MIWNIFGEIREILVEMGGKGSGHWRHRGRKGKRGGSVPSKARKYVHPSKIPFTEKMWGYEGETLTIGSLRELTKRTESTPMPVAPKFAYHKTPGANLEAIRSEGLRVRTAHWPFTTGEKTVSFSLTEKGTKAWKMNNPVLLRVDLQGLDIFDFRHMITDEVRTKVTISPDRIEVVR